MVIFNINYTFAPHLKTDRFILTALHTPHEKKPTQKTNTATRAHGMIECERIKGTKMIWIVLKKTVYNLHL